MAAAIVLDHDANGSHQTIAVGETLTIELPTAGGSGYTWSVSSPPDAAVVEVVSAAQSRSPGYATSTPDGTPLVGTPETVTTVLRGAGVGTTSVTLSHVPPGRGAPPEETFKIDVTVTAVPT